MAVSSVAQAGTPSIFVAEAPAAREPARPPVAAAEPEKPVADTTVQSGRALEIFRQELKFTATAKYCKSCTDPVAAAADTPVSADDVAAEALGDASRLAAENRDISSFALLRFRQRVQAAAAYTQQTVGGDADIDKLDDAVARVNAGLDSLDESASRNVESSASVLSINSSLRQRSTIRIRTQEGDVVRLDVRRASNLSASDVAVSGENGSASRTEVAVSSRSRLLLSVKGDLNDAEYAAIREVFAQAEEIAREFFDGDLAAAFSRASGLEFDAEQLAGVKLRFRSREVTTAAYAAIQSVAPAPAAEPAPALPAPSEPTAGEVADRPAAGVAIPAPLPVPKTIERQPVAADGNDAPGATEAPSPVPSPPSLDDLPFLRFFDRLADFLEGVADGFERQVAGAAEAASYRVHYSQSFKLQIFKSVLELSAPGDTPDDGADLAAKLIDGIAASDVRESDDD